MSARWLPRALGEIVRPEISKKISSALKPKRVETYMTNLFGHEVINLLPVYANETSESKRLPAKKDELQDLAMKIGQMKKAELKIKQKKVKEAKPEMKKESEIIKILRRIP